MWLNVQVYVKSFLYIQSISRVDQSTMADAAGPASTMRAVVRGWTGGMSLDPSYKTPSCGHSEVLLKVKAGAINPVDYKAGRFLGPVVGLDVAGVVEKVGDKVTQLKVGDEVFGSCAGSLADYAVTKPESLGLKPAALSFAEAAAMPCAYLTSLQSIRDAGGLKEGGRVLVLGASGGCGVAAVQIAKAMGAGLHQHPSFKSSLPFVRMPVLMLALKLIPV